MRRIWLSLALLALLTLTPADAQKRRTTSPAPKLSPAEDPKARAARFLNQIGRAHV